MRLIIADTGPINYLILIGHVGLLPRLFDQVILPTAVKRELSDTGASQTVRAWIASPPPWLEIMEAPDPQPIKLDEGEAAVISLALSLHADLVLMDERRGVRVAREQGLRVTGTVGLLEMAAQAGLLEFRDAVDRLRRTSFRSPDALLEAMLEKYHPETGKA